MSYNKDLTVVVDDSFIQCSMAKGEIITDNGCKPQADLIKSLKKYFDPEQVAFLTPESVLGKSKSYELSNGGFKQQEGLQDDLETNLFLIFSVNSRTPKFSYDYLAQQYAAYENFRNQVGKFLNPLHAKKMIDKKYLDELLPEKDVFPKLYQIDGWDDLQEIVQDTPVVLKHRTGAEGEQVYKVNNHNLPETQAIIGGTLEQYVAQELIEADYEKRLIIFGDQVVGGRIIRQRSHPWEDNSKIKKGYSKKPYVPTKEERDLAVELHKAADMYYSAVDFLGNEREQKILEINGICPGLVSRNENGTVYSLNQRFAEYLYNLKCQKQQS